MGAAQLSVTPPHWVCPSHRYDLQNPIKSQNRLAPNGVLSGFIQYVLRASWLLGSLQAVKNIGARQPIRCAPHKKTGASPSVKTNNHFCFCFFLEFLELSLQVEGSKKLERPSSIALPPYSGKSELGCGPRNAGGCEGDLASFGGPPWESHFAELAPPLHVLCISPLEKGINSSSVDFG